MWWNLSQAHNLLIILQQSFYKCRLAERMHQKQGLDTLELSMYISLSAIRDALMICRSGTAQQIKVESLSYVSGSCPGGLSIWEATRITSPIYGGCGMLQTRGKMEAATRGP
jgi:hypothetical protein